MAGFISKVPHDRARPVSDVITISLSYINTILYYTVLLLLDRQESGGRASSNEFV